MCDFKNVGMKTIISNRLIRIAEHPGAFVIIMYVKVAIQIIIKKIKKKMNTDSLNSYTFPVD